MDKHKPYPVVMSGSDGRCRARRGECCGGAPQGGADPVLIGLVRESSLCSRAA